ncbi:trypsin-like serine peptidase [Actinosynnema sp. NPDC059797]
MARRAPSALSALALTATLAAALTATLTAVGGARATAAPPPPDTPVSSDGRVGPTAPAAGVGRATAGFAGTGDPADAEGVRPAAPRPGVPDGAPDGLAAQSIIPPDGRTRVTDTTTYPASADVQVTFTKPNGSAGWCTGWLYASNAVATAGHCAHSGGSGGAWNTNFAVHPGRDGGSSPFGSCGVTSAHSVTGWTLNANPEYDYAGLELDCAVGTATGWYGMSWTTASLDGTAVGSSGYPQDKPAGTQWSTSSSISASYTRQLAYHLDTVGGQDGSVVRAAGCSTVCGIAVHAYGLGDHNRGTRITEAAFANYQAWKL